MNCLELVLLSILRPRRSLTHAGQIDDLRLRAWLVEDKHLLRLTFWVKRKAHSTMDDARLFGREDHADRARRTYSAESRRIATRIGTGRNDLVVTAHSQREEGNARLVKIAAKRDNLSSAAHANFLWPEGQGDRREGHLRRLHC